MITYLKKIVLYVSDQQEALNFYKEKLGFEVLHNEPTGSGTNWVELKPPQGQTHIELYPRSMKKDWENFQTSIIFSCSNIDKTYEELNEKGVNFTNEPGIIFGTDELIASFIDLDGNEILLVEDD